MPLGFFASDLHGHADRYEKLFAAMTRERPGAVFLGGDLLPSGLWALTADGPRDEAFLDQVLIPGLDRVRAALGAAYPRVFMILGNDDARAVESRLLADEVLGLWTYAHGRRCSWDGHDVFGYSFIPPTPFQNKDWERYDVSRFVDPGCSPPDGGFRTVPVSEHELEFGTIARDLARLAGDRDLARSIWLFHAPPHGTPLDRAALDGRMVDHAPVDVHVGSIAVRRFIEARQPQVTLHGHVHEAARLTGQWRMEWGRSRSFTGAHDGPELALVLFDPERPDADRRLLL